MSHPEVFVKWFNSSCVVLVTLAWACGGGNGSPTSPSASQGTLLGIRVSGPASVAPGEIAHYTATAEYSDGSSKDVTAGALWSPVYSETWDPVSRAGFALSFTSPGVTAAGIRGERNLFALYEGTRGMLNVLVLEPGTFKLSGVVTDSSGGSLDDVTVEVLSGTGKGLKTTTNNIGQFGLYGVAGPVQLQTSADGFHAEKRDVVVTGNEGSEPFALFPVETPADISGTWTMTVRSSPRCRPGLPDIAQGRTYEVRLTQQGTTLQWKISSPTLEKNRDASSGFGNTVLGSRVRIEFPGDTDEGEYTSPDLYDRLSPTELFGFTGSAEGTMTGSEIRLALNGSLLYWVERGGFVWYCRTTDHSITLRR